MGGGLFTITASDNVPSAPLRNGWKGKVAFLAVSRTSVKHISRESNLTGSTNQLDTASVHFLLGIILGLSSVHIGDSIDRLFLFQKDHKYFAIFSSES